MRPDPSRTWRRPESGFTLVELVVALSLLALVMTLMLGGLRFGATVWETAATRQSEAQSLEAARRVLRRLIEGAIPLNPGTSRALAFEGGPQALRFVGPPPADLHQGDRYALELRHTGGALELRWRAAPPGSPPFDGAWQRRVLARDVKALRFRYFTAANRNAKPAWREVWRNPPYLPRLVEITLTRKGGATTVTAAPRLTRPVVR